MKDRCSPCVRTGIGYDVHPFDAERPLVLGGVHIPDAAGLVGHSDADVLCHALTDALLGAAALGDIGTHFPDTDSSYAGADSLRLLARAMQLVNSAGYSVVNVDATVIMESPKLAPHVQAMRERISGALGIGLGSVSVKATTHERLGAFGRGEGAACIAIATISG